MPNAARRNGCDPAAETSWLGIALTAGTLVICPWLGRAKQRIAERLGSLPR